MAAKILCIVCFLVTVTGYLSGQDRPFRIGFQASPVFSGMRSKSDIMLKNGGNLGLKLGAISDIAYKENISITAGINFGFHEGGEFIYEVGGNYLPKSELSDPLLQTGDKPLPDGVKIRYQYQYLEFPVGLKFRTASDGNMNWFFEVPVLTFSFLMRGRGDIETEDYFYDQENIYKDMVAANIFLGLGAGVEYAISQNNSLIGGLYFQRGLFDVTRDKGYTAYPNPDIIPTYIKVKEDSRATIGNLILCIGILF
jgi:hypothetical protein